MFLSHNCMFTYLTVLQHGIHLIRRPSHVIDRFVSTYDQHRFGRPSLSTYAQVKSWMLFNYFYYGIFLSYKRKGVWVLTIVSFFCFLLQLLGGRIILATQPSTLHVQQGRVGPDVG
jgi:hypothetical protein